MTNVPIMPRCNRIVYHFGKPNLFITFTCNQKWSEITRELLLYQTAADRPDLTARVFHM